MRARTVRRLLVAEVAIVAFGLVFAVALIAGGAVAFAAGVRGGAAVWVLLAVSAPIVAAGCWWLAVLYERTVRGWVGAVGTATAPDARRHLVAEQTDSSRGQS